MCPLIVSQSFASCSVLCVLATIAQKQRIKATERAEQLALACAFYDQSGRMMVNPQGILPSHMITKNFIAQVLYRWSFPSTELIFKQSFGADEFSRTHPAFIWIFRASRNWDVVSDVIPGMKDHLATDPRASKYRPGTPHFHDRHLDAGMDFDVIFKELFCVAADELAEQIRQPLSRMGVLYEDVMATGTQPAQTVMSALARGSVVRAASLTDVETGAAPVPVQSGRGQVVFVVRKLTRQEANKFSSKGFRFAGVEQISENLAKTMQVGDDELLIRLKKMSEYVVDERLMEPGIHIVCFTLRANLQRSFDVLALKECQNQLPASLLQKDSLSSTQLDTLARLDEKNVLTCLEWLSHRKDSFCQRLRSSILNISQHMNDSEKQRALFSARLIEATCRPPQARHVPGTCTLLSIRLIMDISTESPCKDLIFVPLRFFMAQQQVYTGVANHEAFAHQIHREFARATTIDCSKRHNVNSFDDDRMPDMSQADSTPCCNPGIELTTISQLPTATMVPLQNNEPVLPASASFTAPSRPSLLRDSIMKTVLKAHSLLPFTAGLSDSSERQHIVPSISSGGQIHPLGGIRVSNQVSVDVSEKSETMIVENRQADLPWLRGTQSDIDFRHVVGDFCPLIPQPTSTACDPGANDHSRPACQGTSKAEDSSSPQRHGPVFKVTSVDGNTTITSNTISTFVSPVETEATAKGFGTMGKATATSLEAKTFVDELCDLARLTPRL